MSMTTTQALAEIERLARDEIAPSNMRAATAIILELFKVRLCIINEGERVVAQGPARLAENYGRRDR